MTIFCGGLKNSLFNMFTLKRDSVKQVVGVSVYPSRVLGVFPFKDDGKKFVYSKLYFSFSFVICSIWLSILFDFLFFTLEVHRSSYLSLGANYIGAFIFTIIPICGIWETMHYMEVFNGCVKTFREVELLLSTKGQPLKYFVSLKFFYLECTLLVCVLIFGITDNYFSPVDFWYTSLQMVFHSAVYAQIMGFVHRLAVCLRLLTRLLELCTKDLSTIPKQKFLPTAMPMDRTYRAELLIKAHHKLCLTAESLNDMQKFHVLMIILAAYMWCVVESYELYSIGVCWMYKRDLFAGIMKSAWFGLCFSAIWQIVSSCAECTKKAKKFNTMLYQQMIDDRTNDITNNKKLRLHISMKRKVVFTACGFFTLDYTLVLSMIGAATTYLVILIQFGQSTSTQLFAENNTLHNCN